MAYRIVVFGSGAVGKSALTVQFVQGVFVSDYDPTIEESYHKSIQMDQRQVVFDILDTAGVLAMRDYYILNGQGFLLVYSVLSPASLSELFGTKAQIELVKDSSKVPMVLVGNKIDLEDKRAVSTKEGEDTAMSFGCPFVECSAKTKIGVEKAFIDLVREIDKYLIEREKNAPKKQQNYICNIL